MSITIFMKSLFNHRSKAIFIIALVVMVASCSVKTMYKQLDYLIPSYVEGMVSLDSMLEEKVEQRTLVLINWHRNTQLHQYAAWLHVLQGDANDQLTEEKMLQHISTLDRFWQLLLLKSSEEMASLLPLLNAEQRKELFSNIADKNKDYREENVDVDKDKRIVQYTEHNTEHNTEHMLDNYETWLDDLTDEQESAVKQAATKLQSTAELRLERRLQWQRSIQGILATNDSATQKAVSLGQYFTDYNRRDNVAMNTIEQTNRQILARLTVQIVHNMTEKQNAHFVSRTNDYIRMFNELAAER